MNKDLYGVLGVSKTAGQDEIKSAFRNLAKKYHPDIHQGNKKEAEEKFKEIAAAYKILSDPKQRQMYDNYGFDGMKGRGGFGGYDDIFTNMNMGDIFSDLSDIFGDFFGFDIGGSRGGSRRMHGEDLKIDMYVEFEEAAAEHNHVIELSRKEICDTCGGEGIKPGTTKKKCATCGGQGKIRRTQGFFSMVTVCPACRGEGKTAEHLCESCGGQGLRNKKRKVEVKIPSGVVDGSYLKMRGEGNTGLNGGRTGDLYVVINIKPHEIFEREGDEVVLNLPITMSQAVLGDEVEVPTLYGPHKIKIPAGIQSGDDITVKGKGFPHLNSFGKGDMHVIVKVETPKNANSKLKEAYKNVKLLEKEDNYSETKSGMKKIHKYLKKKK